MRRNFLALWQYKTLARIAALNHFQGQVQTMRQKWWIDALSTAFSEERLADLSAGLFVVVAIQRRKLFRMTPRGEMAHQVHG